MRKLNTKGQPKSDKPLTVKKTIKAVKPGEKSSVEIEDKEYVVGDFTRNGFPQTFVASGKRHSSGGMDINAPDNTFVFSRDKTMRITDPNVLESFGKSAKKIGYDPAAIAKQYDNNDFLRNLLDPDSDHLMRDTAESMIKNNNEKLGKLSLAQEALKGFDQGIPFIALPYMQQMGMDPASLVHGNGDEPVVPTQGEDIGMSTAKTGGTIKIKITGQKMQRGGGLPGTYEGHYMRAIQSNNPDSAEIAEDYISNFRGQNPLSSPGSYIDKLYTGYYGLNRYMQGKVGDENANKGYAGGMEYVGKNMVLSNNQVMSIAAHMNYLKNNYDAKDSYSNIENIYNNFSPADKSRVDSMRNWKPEKKQMGGGSLRPTLTNQQVLDYTEMKGSPAFYQKGGSKYDKLFVDINNQRNEGRKKTHVNKLLLSDNILEDMAQMEADPYVDDNDLRDIRKRWAKAYSAQREDEKKHDRSWAINNAEKQLEYQTRNLSNLERSINRDKEALSSESISRTSHYWAMNDDQIYASLEDKLNKHKQLSGTIDSLQGVISPSKVSLSSSPKKVTVQNTQLAEVVKTSPSKWSGKVPGEDYGVVGNDTISITRQFGGDIVPVMQPGGETELKELGNGKYRSTINGKSVIGTLNSSGQFIPDNPKLSPIKKQTKFTPIEHPQTFAKEHDNLKTFLNDPRNTEYVDQWYNKYKDNLPKGEKPMEKDDFLVNFVDAQSQVYAINNFETDPAVWNHGDPNVTYKKQMDKWGMRALPPNEIGHFQAGIKAGLDLQNSGAKPGYGLMMFKTPQGVSDVDKNFGSRTAHSLAVADFANSAGLTGQVPDSSQSAPGQIPVNHLADPIPVNHLADPMKASTDNPFWTEDLVNLSGALGDYGRIKKYMPWQAGYATTLPNAHYADPTRELAANAEQANIAENAIGAYAGPQELGSRISQIQGNAFKNAADILGKYNNMNIQVANQNEMQRTQIMNTDSLNRANRSTEFYNQGVAANQNFDNAKAMARQNIRQAFNAAWQHRGQTQALNSINKQYRVSPKTGFVEFKQGVPEITPDQQRGDALEYMASLAGNANIKADPALLRQFMGEYFDQQNPNPEKRYKKPLEESWYFK